MNNTAMMDAQNCLMCIEVSERLFDTVSELLLSFEGKNLDFTSVALQLHHSELEAIEEQVSGYEKGYKFQIKTDYLETKAIYQHLISEIRPENFETYLQPLLLKPW